MNEIGGYFQLELAERSSEFHKDGIFLNSGRNALEYILRSISFIKKIYIPYYTCDAVIEPLKKINVEYEFYSINEQLEMIDNIDLTINEYIIYTNYFGVKDKYINRLLSLYSNQLIVDNSQALFYKPSLYSFYSPRKFVGLPDGGIAYSKNLLDSSLPKDLSYDKCSHLLKRFDLLAFEGYEDFKKNSNKIYGRDIKYMSNLTNALFRNIDFDEVKTKRMSNFYMLHKFFKEINPIDLDLLSFSCAMVYPLYIESESLRTKLIENKVYVAKYWENVLKWVNCDKIEFNLVQYLLPLPIDQRYSDKDMQRIIDIIKNSL